MTEENRHTAVIVGASLSGLMTGLALARHGIHVTILERAFDLPRIGAALGADERPVERVTGVRLTGVRLTGRGGTAKRLPLSWTLVHSQLRAAAAAHPFIDVRNNAGVTAVAQNDQRAWAVTRDNQEISGDVLIGADGHHSVVRGIVSPNHPDATFAGYVIWLGMADENELPSTGKWPDETAFVSAAGEYLLGYPLPAEDGTLAPDRRRLGWAWYDAAHNDLLRRTGSVAGTVVQHSLRAETIPEGTFAQLQEQAAQQWPEPWRSAVVAATGRKQITGTPVAEYVPEQLVQGRIALVGDAAHVPTPMTGAGFSESLDDADALASLLGLACPAQVEDALQAYEVQRLATVRATVQAGQQFSRSFSST